MIGRLGSVPEIKNFENGKKRAKLSLATSESYRNQQGEKVDETQWHNLQVWGKLADICEQYLDKGSEIAIEGKLTYRDYSDANGQKRSITEIQVNELLMLDKKVMAD